MWVSCSDIPVTVCAVPFRWHAGSIPQSRWWLQSSFPHTELSTRMRFTSLHTWLKIFPIQVQDFCLQRNLRLEGEGILFSHRWLIFSWLNYGGEPHLSLWLEGPSYQSSPWLSRLLYGESISYDLCKAGAVLGQANPSTWSLSQMDEASLCAFHQPQEVRLGHHLASTWFSPNTSRPANFLAGVSYLKNPKHACKR